MSTELLRESEGKGERAWRILRNINAVAAVAFAGFGLVIDSGVVLTWAGVNAGQAGFFEILRRGAKNKSRTRPKFA